MPRPGRAAGSPGSRWPSFAVLTCRSPLKREIFSCDRRGAQVKRDDDMARSDAVGTGNSIANRFLAPPAADRTPAGAVESFCGSEMDNLSQKP
jgi:hypothetical protein